MEVVLGLNIKLCIYLVRGLTGYPFVDNSHFCPAGGTGAEATQKVQLIRQTAQTAGTHWGGVYTSQENKHTRIFRIYVAQSNVVIVHN